ncbi:peroxiredoxin [Spirillospora sp. NPDC029432]|uniref:peroxiredoxin n=1 Tax=Spirillospora sp. NPDC029432 TaxID=3154599 RepID=UPI0034560739
MRTVPEVGTEAPDFTLADQDHREVTLSAFRGRRNVLVVFYPCAFSGICTGELCAVRDDIGAFQNGNAQILGISADHVFALKAWSLEEGYSFPLLSDYWPHGEVAARYGVLDRDRGMALRGTFLIDKSGTVRFTEVRAPGEARDQDRWKEALATLD